MLSTTNLKVKPFYRRFIKVRFHELMLHRKVCTFSFSELLTWIKGRFDCTWKTWRTKEIDWGPSATLPNGLHKANMSVLAQERKESKSKTFWILVSDCRKFSTCNCCHDFIRTPIGVILDFVESVSSLLSNRSVLTSISIRSCTQSLFS